MNYELYLLLGWSCERCSLNKYDVVAGSNLFEKIRLRCCDRHTVPRLLNVSRNEEELIIRKERYETIEADLASLLMSGIDLSGGDELSSPVRRRSRRLMEAANSRDATPDMDIRSPASATPSPASSSRSTASSIRSPASAIRSPASSIRSPASSIRSPASSIRSPASATPSPAERQHAGPSRGDATTSRGHDPKRDMDERVPIGKGNVTINSFLLENMDWSDCSKATRKLLMDVFKHDVLATHSLSGKPSPAFIDRQPKKRLDPDVVDDIVSTVSMKCSVAPSIVRKYITSKCADDSRTLKKRQSGNISPSD